MPAYAAMNMSARRSALLRRCALALGLGILQAAAFPKAGLDWVAWLTPGLVLMLVLGQTGWNAFRIGYCAGLAHYLLSLYWLLLIPIPAKAVAGWFALAAILALFTASWTWLCWRIFPARLEQGKIGDTKKGVLCEGNLSASTWRQRTVWSLACACAWVGVEMGLTRILTGFPWNLLGASQYKHVALIQIASVTGIYGISFLVVWVSVSLAMAVMRGVPLQYHERSARAPSPATQHKSAKSKTADRFPLSPAEGERVGVRGNVGTIQPILDLALPASVLLAVIGFGLHRLSSEEPVERELKLALIQPSIPQLVIWDDREKSNRFHKLVMLSQQAAATRPDVLVWPEAALPNILTRFNRQTYEAVTNLVAPNHLWMIFGASDAEPTKTPGTARDADFFNSAFLVDPGGQLVARYHKRHLVMFGEYMPLADWFPFLNRLRNLKGGFTSGEASVPFSLTDLGAKISVLICFEDIFPQLVRDSVSDDTDFLVNLTNNGWFGESAAQWQHAVSALFRAVENGLPLVRCTNNGLTCWVDSRGRLHDVYFPGTGDIYGAGFKLVSIPLRPHGKNGSSTFYHRHGDWFAWSCVAVIAILLAKRISIKGRTGHFFNHR